MYIKDDDNEEKEDFNIKSDDNLIVAGHVDQDFSNLEISGKVNYKTLHQGWWFQAVLAPHCCVCFLKLCFTYSNYNTGDIHVQLYC